MFRAGIGNLAAVRSRIQKLKNWRGPHRIVNSSIACPIFIDVCPNHNLLALHGNKKKLYPKFMVKTKKTFICLLFPEFCLEKLELALVLSNHTQAASKKITLPDLERRDCDQNGCASKPTRTIPLERHFAVLSPAWQSWQAVLIFSFSKN